MTKAKGAFRDYANGPKDGDIKGSVRVVPCSNGNWDGNRDS